MSNKSKIIKSKKNSIIILIGFIFMFISIDSFAQVLKPFNQRTSTQVEDKYKNKTIYNLRGDFKMIGNTNLSRNSTRDATNNPTTGTQDEWSNSNTDMYFVDVDGDNNTSNSSKAELSLPANCTNIVYAGLYWSGRNNVSDVVNSTVNANATNTSIIQINNSNLTTTITTSSQNLGGDSVNVPYYVIKNTNSSIYYEFRFKSRRYTTGFIFQNHNNYDNENVEYRTSSNGTWLPLEVTFSGGGSGNNIRTATLISPISITSGDDIIIINSISKRKENNSTINQNHYISYRKVSNTGVYTGNKIKIKFKKEGQLYQNLIADDYYIGSSDDADIYTAYKDVTAYVKQHGVGNYFGADIDLVEGNGGSAGYFGGWGLIVIYENPTMNWRDITIFDGYAHVAGNTYYQLPLSGFRAAQNGAVNVTMGMMAGEGDRGISGDNFRIRNSANNAWVYLNHSGNQTSGNSNSNNFFNSSILTDGSRFPNYSNNTGLDIAKFNLSNANNSLIGNNQTSTTFRYGSDGEDTDNRDTYVIYNIVFAVDAYVPNAQNENSPLSIFIPDGPNSSTGTTLNSGSSEFNYRIEHLQPNDEVTVAMNLYNYGNEKIVGPVVNQNTGARDPVQMNINIPFGMTLKSASVTPYSTDNDVLPNATVSGNVPSNYATHFNNLFWINPTNNQTTNLNDIPATLPTTQMGGILSWRPIDIPRQNENSTTRKSMAKLTYTLKVIDNCTILKSSEDNCILDSSISGMNIGFGANSGTPMAEDFVIGYSNPTCGNLVPIYGNTVMEIVPSEAYFQTCGGSVLGEEILITHFCEPTSNATLNWNEIINFYPPGTKYYKVKPSMPNYLSSEIIYVENGIIPLQLEATGINGEYEEWIYAMLPGVTNLSCYFNIHIIYTTIYTSPVVNNDLKICANVPFSWPLNLSSYGQQNGLSIQVFSSNSLTNLLPETYSISNPGVYTFYAREVLKNTLGEVLCAGPLVPFNVTVDGCPIPINPMIQTPLNRN